LRLIELGFLVPAGSQDAVPADGGIMKGALTPASNNANVVPVETLNRIELLAARKVD